MCNPKTILLSKPLGFCRGVRRALELFDQTALRYPGETIYVLYELVHNKIVTERMKRRGARFVESLPDIPDGAVALFGAHGVGAGVIAEAERRGIRYCDAVCPLVAQLQRLAAQMPQDCPLILLGDKEHPEIRSVIERAASRHVYVIETSADADALPVLDRALFLSQTTRNQQEVAAIGRVLAGRIPGLDNQARVCDAVMKRQSAVLDLSKHCDLVLVMASPHSSNGRRLADIASENCTAVLLEGADGLTDELLEDCQTVGITAATSTPDDVVQGMVDELLKRGYSLSGGTGEKQQ